MVDGQRKMHQQTSGQVDRELVWMLVMMEVMMANPWDLTLEEEVVVVVVAVVGLQVLSLLLHNVLCHLRQVASPI